MTVHEKAPCSKINFNWTKVIYLLFRYNRFGRLIQLFLPRFHMNDGKWTESAERQMRNGIYARSFYLVLFQHSSFRCKPCRQKSSMLSWDWEYLLKGEKPQEKQAVWKQMQQQK